MDRDLPTVATPARQTEIFVSYAREDAAVVERLAGEIASRGREAWLDRDDLSPAGEWRDEIGAAIERADACAFVLSPDFVASAECAVELERAVRGGKRLVPLVAREVDPAAVPEALARLNWIALGEGDGFGRGVDALVRAAETDLEWVRVHTRLLQRAAEWAAAGRDAGFLLQGHDLAEAEGSLARGAEKEPRPTVLQAEYLVAGRREAARRRQRWIRATSLALVVTTALAIVAGWQYVLAERRGRLATAGQLAARAQLSLVISPTARALGVADPQRGALLALESLDIVPTVEGDRALRNALDMFSPAETSQVVEHEPGLLALSADRQWIVTSTHGDTVLVREAATGREALRIAPRDSVTAAALDREGRRVAAAGRDTLRVWDVRARRPIARWPYARPMRALAFAPDGRTLVAVEARTARVWDVATGRETARVPLGAGEPRGVALSPEARWLAVADTAGLVRVRDLSASAETARLSLSEGMDASSIALAPGGARLAAGSFDTVFVLETNGGRRTATLKHEWGVQGMAFDTSGSWLATVTGRVSMDAAEPSAEALPGSTIRLWEVAEGREAVSVSLTEEAGVLSLAFSPDGASVAVVTPLMTEEDLESGESGVYARRVWPLLPADLRAKACASLTRSLSESEWKRYMGGAPYRRTCPALPPPER